MQTVATHQHPIQNTGSKQPGHLVSLLFQQLLTVYIFKQGITWGVMASHSAMTVANLFHFGSVTKFILFCGKAAGHPVLINC
jgi:hypothetical protein